MFMLINIMQSSTPEIVVLCHLNSMSSTKFVFFRADRKNKMAALASDWLRHFSTSSLKPLNRIQRNLIRSKILMSSTKFVFFWTIGKNKIAALTSDWLRQFRLLVLTAERNSTKLDRKQDLNVLYQVCVFRADQ